MSSMRENKCGCVCGSVVGLFLIIFCLILISDDDFSNWADSRQGVAAWFQFFGAMLSIGGAVYASNSVYLKERRDRKNDERRIASVKAVSLISNLLTVREKLNSFISGRNNFFSHKTPSDLDFLLKIINNASLPSDDFAISMVHIDSDCSKSIAISNESLRQLRLHLERYQGFDFGNSEYKNSSINGLFKLLHENIEISCDLIVKFLKEEGMEVYSGKAL